nr:kainate receptor 41 kda polypeptide {internal fragment} [Carassius auratus=goldfish, brain, Peptide Partial, 17 aa] [Carassius auratus]
ARQGLIVTTIKQDPYTM